MQVPLQTGRHAFNNVIRVKKHTTLVAKLSRVSGQSGQHMQECLVQDQTLKGVLIETKSLLPLRAKS